MSRVVIQLIDDTGHVHNEMAVIEGATAETAAQVMEELADALECAKSSARRVHH